MGSIRYRDNNGNLHKNYFGGMDLNPILNRLEDLEKDKLSKPLIDVQGRKVIAGIDATGAGIGITIGEASLEDMGTVPATKDAAHVLAPGYLYYFHGGITSQAYFNISDGTTTLGPFKMGWCMAQMFGPSVCLFINAVNNSNVSINSANVSSSSITGSGSNWYWGIYNTTGYLLSGLRLSRMKIGVSM